MPRLTAALVALATFSLAAPALAADPVPLVGRWADDDGAMYEIEQRGEEAVLARAHLGERPLQIQQSAWSTDGLTFAVRVPEVNRTITYKVLSADDTTMQTLWWTEDGRGGQETLRRAAPPEKDPALLIGRWEQRSVKSSYYIMEVDGVPAVVGGVDARGVPKMVTARNVTGSVAIWTIKVPKTGFETTYRCTPGARESELACTWSSVSPQGQRRDGNEVLRRLPL